MIKICLTLFVLMFTVFAMENTVKYTSCNDVPTSEFELIEQSIEEEISNLENTVQVLFDQSAEGMRYEYLEVHIFGNEEYHKQMNGLYIKHFHSIDCYSYLKIYPNYGNTFIVWNPILLHPWKVMHDGKTIAVFEDQILINPLFSNKKTIIRNYFERESVYLTPLDFAPRSAHGNYYDHADYKYLIYHAKINDQNYVMGVAKYYFSDAKWHTVPLVQDSMKQNVAKEFARMVKFFLGKTSHPNRDSIDDHLPTSIYSGFPSNYYLHFFP